MSAFFFCNISLTLSNEERKLNIYISKRCRCNAFGKGVRITIQDMENRRRKDYAEMINVIANTCLMYCDRASLGTHIDYNLETNNASSMVPFRQKSTFCELANELNSWYDGIFDLESLLVDYDEASQIFVDFKRSYAIDLHDDVAVDKRQQIFQIINFFSPVVDNNSELSFLNNDKKSILTDIKNEKSAQFQSIFILLMIGLLPSYSSKKGSASQMKKDFHLLMDFLRDYGKQAPTLDAVKDSPILTGFETWVKENDESELRRVDLINMTKKFLETSFGFSSFENSFLLNKQIERFYPEIEGFWSDSPTPGSHFWKIEMLANAYIIYDFNLKSDTKELVFTKFEGYIYGKDTDEASLFICHPSMVRKMINHEDSQNFKEWSELDIEDDENGKITKLKLHPRIRIGKGMLPMNLYRIDNEEYYESILNNNQLEIKNLFSDDEYSLFFNQYAITREHLYILLDENDIRQLDLPDSSSKQYLKIPKYLDPCLDMLTLDDEWGICNFNNGDSYFTVINSMLYFKIDTRAEREELGIEIVERIE